MNSVIEKTKQANDGIGRIKTAKTGRKIFLETYGCQMNFSDSGIVASILSEEGFHLTDDPSKSEVILINTCSIRDHAEQRVRNRLSEIQSLKKKHPKLVIGIIGCMAERLKTKLLEEEKLIDIIAGPDSYRHLPSLISEVKDGRKAVNTILSTEETYADVSPVRLSGNGVTSFISIMRGCDNMCSFCVVPFTRGRERSRDPESIVKEAEFLFDNGYREVTLLGQNVDSYCWNPGYHSRKEIVKNNLQQAKTTVNFSNLLERVAKVSPQLRVRFSTSYPQDMSDDVLHIMSRYENICKYIHLPVQSGSNGVLERMNRGYTREWYMERIKAIRNILPDCGISTDIITGFCGETEEDHRQTLSLMKVAAFDFAYMFKYSERPGTPAAKKFRDDVPDDVKTKRLEEVISQQQELSLQSNRKAVGKVHKVLVEGTSKRSEDHLYGRNTQNTVVVFPKENLPAGRPSFKPGDYAEVLAEKCTAATLKGRTISGIKLLY